jgi:hypothetical protein
MKKLLNSNSWWFYFILAFLIIWPVRGSGIGNLPENQKSVSLPDTSTVSPGTAIMTYVSSGEYDTIT